MIVYAYWSCFQALKAFISQFSNNISVWSHKPASWVVASELLDDIPWVLYQHFEIRFEQGHYNLELISKIWSFVPVADLLSWTKDNWKGLTDLFYLDNGSSFFIALFDSSVAHNDVHRIKNWFCKGIGLYIMFGRRILGLTSLHVHSCPFGWNFHLYLWNIMSLILLNPLLIS